MAVHSSKIGRRPPQPKHTAMAPRPLRQWHHVHSPKVGRHPPPNHRKLQWHHTWKNKACHKGANYTDWQEFESCTTLTGVVDTGCYCSYNIIRQFWMNCGQLATVAVCAFAPTGLLADPPGQRPREAACGVSPHGSCGPKRGTLPWPLSFPKTRSQMPWHSQLMGKERQPAFVHCHGSSAHAAATLLPRRGSTCNSPSMEIKKIARWKHQLLHASPLSCQKPRVTDSFDAHAFFQASPGLCHFLRPPRGEVQRVLPRGAQRPLADNLPGALGEHHLVVLQAVFFASPCAAAVRLPGHELQPHMPTV